jgi:hypothetical protein
MTLRSPPRLFCASLRLPVLALVPTLLLGGCSGQVDTGSGQFKLEAWADNWFSLSLGDTLVVEDPVSITTERSFNAVTHSFDATLPMNLNFILKDFKENDSGLEYIGTEQQQMGDGGFIAQITDSETASVIAVSDASWRCTAIHVAPTNKDCEDDADPVATCLSEISDEPEGWTDADHDTSAWSSATVHSEDDVQPKDGYDEISWNADAELIWTADLETDNTVLCKVTVEG